VRTLEVCGNNHAEAAKKLGIARSSLYRKLNEFDPGE
jgi:transcriptional regulator of acetoin/glycerol metabolism